MARSECQACPSGAVRGVATQATFVIQIVKLARSAQPSLVLGPVRQAVLHLGEAVQAANAELVGHRELRFRSRRRPLLGLACRPARMPS